jgi:Major intrinsic protein
MFVWHAACNPRSNVTTFGPLVVGMTFGTLLTVFSPFSSGSLNPARTLGPAAVTGISDDLWIWVVGPFLGAIIAVPLHLIQVHAPSSDLYDTAIARRMPTADTEGRLAAETKDAVEVWPDGEAEADKKRGTRDSHIAGDVNSTRIASLRH